MIAFNLHTTLVHIPSVPGSSDHDRKCAYRGCKIGWISETNDWAYASGPCSPLGVTGNLGVNGVDVPAGS